MHVIKRDGRSESFDINKIIVSIERASDDLGISINESDGRNIAGYVHERVRALNKNEVNVEDIKNMVIESLNGLGFSQIAGIYDEGKGYNVTFS